MVLVDIVDENDNIIETKDSSLVKRSDIKRSSCIFLFNKEGEILLQLRAKHDSKFPNCWDISAGGGVDAGESYEVAIQREAEEEIGVNKELALELISYTLFQVEEDRRYYAKVYKAEYGGPFTVDPNEVDKVEFFSIEKIKEMVEQGVGFHPECLYILKKFIL